MTKTMIPPDWKILPNTMGLVYLAELNFMIIEKIYHELDHDNKKHPAYYFLAFSASNSFFESVNILYTLLCSTKKEELRIKPLLLDSLKGKDGRVLKESIEKFNALKLRFEKYNFGKVRHNAGAHKNKKLPYPTGATSQLIQERFIISLGSIITELKNNTHTWFNYTLDNPYSHILDHLDKVILMN